MLAFSSSDNYYLSSANSLESGPRTTKREERKRRDTHSAGSLHGLGHDFSEFFCCLGGLNAFVCVCVFKKVKDFERGEGDYSFPGGTLEQQWDHWNEHAEEKLFHYSGKKGEQGGRGKQCGMIRNTVSVKHR